MPPTFGKFATYNLENNDALRVLLEDACRRRGLKRDYIAEKSALNSKDLSNWLNKSKEFGAARYYRIVLFCIEEGIINDEKNLLFSDVLGMEWSEKLDREVINEIRGHYVIYRYSYLARGWILKGRLDIEYKKEANVFTTVEKHRVQPGIAGSEGETIFIRKGLYLLRGGDSYVMISRKLSNNREFQIAYLEALGQHNVMRGSFSDWHGKQFYVARMYALKRRVEVPDDDIRAVGFDDVDKTILDYLTESGISDSSLVIFN